MSYACTIAVAVVPIAERSAVASHTIGGFNNLTKPVNFINYSQNPNKKAHLLHNGCAFLASMKHVISCACSR